MATSKTQSKHLFALILFYIFNFTLAYTPTAFSIGKSPVIDGLQTYTGQPFTLNTSSPVATFDYGSLVAGFPYVQIASEVPVQIELKYSEPFDGLNLPYGDGPW